MLKNDFPCMKMTILCDFFVDEGTNQGRIQGAWRLEQSVQTSYSIEAVDNRCMDGV